MWKHNQRDNFNSILDFSEENIQGDIKKELIDNNPTPLIFFKIIFSVNIAFNITEESNEYFLSKVIEKISENYSTNYKDYTKNSYYCLFFEQKRIDPEEIYDYIWCLIYMGLYYYSLLFPIISIDTGKTAYFFKYYAEYYIKKQI